VNHDTQTFTNPCTEQNRPVFDAITWSILQHMNVHEVLNIYGIELIIALLKHCQDNHIHSLEEKYK